MTCCFPGRDRNQRKLLKLLSRIRRRAGRIRDIDVQLAALRSFKVPQEPRRKTQLMQRLIDLRVQHEHKLAKLLNKRTMTELTKRIRRASQNLERRLCHDPLVLANEILSSASTAGPLSDDILHRYRVAVKRARYAAEFAPRSAESDRFIAGLEHLQDALGNWHDWMTLTRTASEHLGEIGESSLVAALHNVTRVSFAMPWLLFRYHAPDLLQEILSPARRNLQSGPARHRAKPHNPLSNSPRVTLRVAACRLGAFDAYLRRGRYRLKFSPAQDRALATWTSSRRCTRTAK